MITIFDNLADLSLIEIFSYLSCVDALHSFSNLNTRLTYLLTEHGFYCHINLSSSRYNKFQSILSLLRINEIRSLIIDCYASPFQLKNWPYLPNLTILKVKGVREYVDVFNFAKQYQNTLTHLTAESNKYFATVGATNNICYPSWNLCDFVTNILNNFFSLESLDFGIHKTNHLHYWSLKRVESHLTYLRITILTPMVLFNLMNTQPLSSTLRQLHITMSDLLGRSVNPKFPNRNRWPRMKALDTFSFIKSFDFNLDKEWLLIDTLTCPSVMPLLRRMSFCIVIDTDDLYQMYHSSLFTDYRQIDVNYAFIVNDNREHIQIIDCIQHYNQFHRRQIVSATYIYQCLPNLHLVKTNNTCMIKSKIRQHLFYTLPWIFNDFIQLCVPNRCITDLQVFIPSFSTNINCCSCLVKLNMSDNLPSIVTYLPNVISSSQILELHLLRCDRYVSVNLPSLSHLILTDSLDSLNNCTLLTNNLKSIKIVLHYQYLHMGNDDWTSLRILSTLPRLLSLRIILYDMRFSPNDRSCQIIAETATIVSDFSFCFRRYMYEIDYDTDIVGIKHSLFIEQLRNRILSLTLNEQPYLIIEEDGQGIIIWF